MPAGNTLSTATTLSLNSNSLQIAGDSVNSAANGSDFYHFNLTGRSSFSLSLNSLTPNGDVNVELLNSTGSPLSLNGVVQRSDNAGNLLDTLYIDDLSAGQYYIHVYTSSNSAANYSLDLASNTNLESALIWRNYGTPGESGKTVLWTMNGVTPSQTAESPVVADLNWQIAGSGDFNADGQADLVWRNYSTTGADAGKVLIWTMNGAVPIASIALPFQVTDPNWRIDAIADFNADGQADLVWRNYGVSGSSVDAGKVQIWTMNGVNPVQTVALPFVVSDTNWRIEGAADFNQDTRPDLVWRNYGVTGADAGKVQIWTMNGINPLQTVVMPFQVTDTNWHIEGIADLNGDTQADLVWRHYGASGSSPDAGKVQIWTMSGVNPLQTVVMPFLVADPNWHLEGVRSHYSTPTRLDPTANTLNNALNLGTLTTHGAFDEFVSSADPDDYYQFTIGNTGNYELSLTGLNGDATLHLLDSNGKLLGTSERSGITAESIIQTLTAGTTYYAHIFSSGPLSSHYHFELSTSNANINIPIVDLNGAASGCDSNSSFTRNGGAVAIGNSGLTLRDVDSPNLASATITITNLLDGAAETLSVSTQLALNFGISANYTAGVLTLTGNASQAQYQSLLQSITYNNTAPNANTTARIIEFMIHDGMNMSDIATSTVAIV